MTIREEQLYKYLIINYNKKSKSELESDLGLSWSYIQKKCHLFKIKRIFNDSKNSHSIRNILEYDNISCYWLGFLLADGHISKHNNIQVNLSTKDEKHFSKIENHLKIKLKPYYNQELNCVRYVISDKPTILEIKSRFNWSTNKTKNPPTISNFDYNQIFSLIVGFIDGDGYISKKGITIKCDVSWFDILNYFYLVLTGESKAFSNNDNSCYKIYINKFEFLRKIKNKAIELDLPIMDRKWINIDIDRVLKVDKYKILYNQLISGSVDKINEFSKSFIFKVKSDIRNNNIRNE